MSKIDDEEFRAITRTMQIIVGSLAAGVVMFWVVVTVVVPKAGGPGPGPAAVGPPILGLPLLTAVSVVFGAVSVVASILVPRLLVDGAVGRMAKGIGPDSTSTTAEPPGAKRVDPASEADKLLPVYQTQLIIASALNEGGAFLAGIAYMLERHAAAILVAGVLLALLLGRFPTAERIQAWLATQLERLAAKRRDDF